MQHSPLSPGGAALSGSVSFNNVNSPLSKGPSPSTPTAPGGPSFATAVPEREDQGPSEPVHHEPPTEEELQQNAAFLKQVQFTVESKKQGERRAGVLNRLEKLIRTWMGNLLRLKGYPNPEGHGGRLITFGSYKLGVHFPGADIDTLCIAPSDVDREDFFDTLVNILRKHKVVKELNPVRNAHVPVIKMKFDEVQIDLVFTALDLERIPPTPPFDIGADSLLRNLDDASQRSINGSRVAEKLLRCVPAEESFRWTLRGIKLWAKNRGIYGNIFGFPGGVAWAIMTSAVCQLYPVSPPSVLLRNFFAQYRKSIKDDGNNAPIFLTKSLEVSAEHQKKSWDRKNVQFELFPVITPMPPYMNACYNVGLSNLRVLCHEFARGEEIVERQLSRGRNVDWSELWEPTDFFLRYKVFMQIEVSAEDSLSFNSWSAFVESKLRHLVTFLETWPQFSNIYEITKTSYQLEIRLWPFLFRNSAPHERLPFTKELAQAMVDETREATPPSVAPAASADNPNETLPEGLITGYYFIGFDTCEQSVSEGEARQIVNFEGAIDQFQQQLFWVGKTDKMLLPAISIVKRRQLPEWVLSEHEISVLREKDAALETRLSAKRQKKAQAASDAGNTCPAAPAAHADEAMPAPNSDAPQPASSMQTDLVAEDASDTPASAAVESTPATPPLA